MTDARVAPDDTRSESSHLQDVDDGCGCAEIWELLTERRASD